MRREASTAFRLATIYRTKKYCQMHHIANSQAEVSFPGMPSTEREGRSTNLLDLFHECGVCAFWPELTSEVLSVPNKGVCKLLQSGRNGCGISLFKGFSFVTIKPGGHLPLRGRFSRSVVLKGLFHSRKHRAWYARFVTVEFFPVGEQSPNNPQQFGCK